MLSDSASCALCPVIPKHLKIHTLSLRLDSPPLSVVTPVEDSKPKINKVAPSPGNETGRDTLLTSVLQGWHKV
ncbi:hypothetical protein AGIG_G22940 [Arapaima gigas]